MSRLRISILYLLSSILLLCAGTGCNVLAIAGAVVPPPNIEAAYHGLEHQKVAIMVWADRAVRIDYPSMQIDAATAMQSKFNNLLKANKETRELEGMTFPYPPASVARWQRDHPEVEGQSVTEFAPRLGGITRLIYVEIHGFQTRSDASLELFRGNLTGSLKVVEITDGKAKIAYEENDILVTYPPKSPPEGILHSNDYTIYLGTLDRFAVMIVNRFVEHESEE